MRVRPASSWFWRIETFDAERRKGGRGKAAGGDRGVFGFVLIHAKLLHRRRADEQRRLGLRARRTQQRFGEQRAIVGEVIDHALRTQRLIRPGGFAGRDGHLHVTLEVARLDVAHRIEIPRAAAHHLHRVGRPGEDDGMIGTQFDPVAIVANADDEHVAAKHDGDETVRRFLERKALRLKRQRLARLFGALCRRRRGRDRRRRNAGWRQRGCDRLLQLAARGLATQLRGSEVVNVCRTTCRRQIGHVELHVGPGLDGDEQLATFTGDRAARGLCVAEQGDLDRVGRVRVVAAVQPHDRTIGRHGGVVRVDRYAVLDEQNAGPAVFPVRGDVAANAQLVAGDIGACGRRAGGDRKQRDHRRDGGRRRSSGGPTRQAQRQNGLLPSRHSRRAGKSDSTSGSRGARIFASRQPVKNAATNDDRAASLSRAVGSELQSLHDGRPTHAAD